MIKGETKYSAKARQLQDYWRIRKGYPIGYYKDRNGQILELGNYIERHFAFNTGANFLNENIFLVVKNALKNKEKGAKIETTRLFTNLLTSQALAFNLFAELSLDHNKATEFFSDLYPDRIQNVTRIIFEHSDGRGDCNYTCDHSAFDVFVEYKPFRGNNGFIGIEVKYSENLRDAPAKHKKRYEDLTFSSGMFKPDSVESLKKSPIQQIWRDHLLSIAHLNHPNKKYDEGFFVYLYPKDNDECKNGVRKYIEQFNSFDAVSGTYDEYSTGFYITFLEAVISKLRQLYNEDWTNELSIRYLGKPFLSE